MRNGVASNYNFPDGKVPELFKYRWVFVVLATTAGLALCILAGYKGNAVGQAFAAGLGYVTNESIKARFKKYLKPETQSESNNKPPAEEKTPCMACLKMTTHKVENGIPMCSNCGNSKKK